MATKTAEPTTALATLDNYAVLKGGSAEKTIRAMAANMGGGQISVFDLTRIRIPAGGSLQWEVTKLGNTSYYPALTGVVVGNSIGRTYWKNPLTGGAGGGQRPDCSSFDAITGHGTPGGSCDVCAFSKFGPNQERPACKLQRTLLFLREEDKLPVTMVLPPTSAAAMKQYLLDLASEGLAYWEAITSLSLVKAKGNANIEYSLLVPSLVGALPQDQADQMGSYQASLSQALTRSRPSSAAAEAAVDDLEDTEY